MSTVAGSPQRTQLGHDVMNLVEKLREHIENFTEASSRQIKVRTYDDVVHSDIYIDAGKHHRLTPHGLIEKKAKWRRTSVLGRHAICMLSDDELYAIRITLIDLFLRLRTHEEAIV